MEMKPMHYRRMYNAKSVLKTLEFREFIGNLSRAGIRHSVEMQQIRGFCIGLPNPWRWAYQRMYSTLSPVTTGMGDRLRAGAYTTSVLISHSGQLSLAIPPWVGAVSTGDGSGHR